MSRFTTKFIVLGTFIAMVATSVASGATDIAPNGGATSTERVPAKKARPVPSSNGWAAGVKVRVAVPEKRTGTIESLVKSGHASQRVRRNSWGQNVLPSQSVPKGPAESPPVSKKAMAVKKEATLESIMAEIAAENGANGRTKSEDANRWPQKDQNGWEHGQGQANEIWSFTPLSAPSDNPDDGVFGDFDNPLAEISAYGDMTTNAKWLISITSNYFQSTEQMADLTRNNGKVARGGGGGGESASSGDGGGGSGSSIPAYVTLLLIFFGLASIVASRSRA